MINCERLICLRRSRGLTQLTVSKDLYISRSTYSSYERGIRQPSSDMLTRLASFYGVSTDYLLGRSDTPLLFSGLPPRDVSLLNGLISASDDEKQVIHFILRRSLG